MPNNNKRAVKALTGGLVLACLASVLLYYMIKDITHELSLYIAESDCVATKITLGIEREDIRTGNGTCWIKESALDKPLN